MSMSMVNGEHGCHDGENEQYHGEYLHGGEHEHHGEHDPHHGE